MAVVHGRERVLRTCSVVHYVFFFVFVAPCSIPPSYHTTGRIQGGGGGGGGGGKGATPPGKVSSSVIWFIFLLSSSTISFTFHKNTINREEQKWVCHNPIMSEL